MKKFVFKKDDGFEEIYFDLDASTKQEFIEKNNSVSIERLEEAWLLLESERSQDEKFEALIGNTQVDN